MSIPKHMVDFVQFFPDQCLRGFKKEDGTVVVVDYNDPRFFDAPYEYGVGQTADGDCFAVVYVPDQMITPEEACSRKEPEGIWWCNAHQREATYRHKNLCWRCEPGLPGITAPCRVVFAPMRLIEDGSEGDSKPDSST